MICKEDENMEEFKFILSTEKFAEIDSEFEVDDIIYIAKLVSDNIYLVRWETDSGWEGLEYSKADVEANLEDGFWVKYN
jgi:hypothetical protein